MSSRVITWRGQSSDLWGRGSSRCQRRGEGIPETVKSLAPRREHVLCQVVLVLFPSVVLPEEELDGAPHGLDRISVGHGVGIDEVNSVVDGAVRETLRPEIAGRSPTVTDDRSAWFDPVTYNGHQGVSGLSGIGTRNVLPDSRSTQPKSH